MMWLRQRIEAAARRPRGVSSALPPSKSQEPPSDQHVLRISYSHSDLALLSSIIDGWRDCRMLGDRGKRTDTD